MILVKLGGSVLTNKGTSGRPRFHRSVALRLLREVRRATRGEPFVLVHGAGSFGHPQALRFGIGRRRLAGRRLAEAVVQTRDAVRRLRGHVMEACAAVGLPAVDLPAAVLGHATASGVRFDAASVARVVEAALVPVTGGDVILDARLGARILSGDEILALLSRALHPERVVFVSDVDGIRRGRRLQPRLRAPEARALVGHMPAGGDATGGMRGKLQHAVAIAEAGTPVVVVSGRMRGRVEAACRGRRVGTLITA